MTTTYFLFPIDNYRFGNNKSSKKNKDSSFEHRLLRFKTLFDQMGIRISVYGVVLVSYHSTPHILILKGPQENRFELPGGHVKTQDDEVQELRTKLNKQLMPNLKTLSFEWEIGELVAVFYRPSHQRYVLPYMPPHISTTK